MNIDKLKNLGPKMVQMAEYIDKLANWAIENQGSVGYVVLRDRFNGFYDTMYQCLIQAENKQQEIAGYNSLLIKQQQLDIYVTEMNTKVTEIDVANKLVDCASQVLQIERAIEDKRLSEENGKNYINGQYTSNFQEADGQYFTSKGNNVRFDEQSTLKQVVLDLFEMSKNYESSLSSVNGNPKSTQEEVDEICKIQTIEPDKQEIESINSDKQQLDTRIQQAINEVVKDIGSDEVIDDWIRDLQEIEICLTEKQRMGYGFGYRIDDAIARVNIMEKRIEEFQLYTTRENIASEDKVQELKILEQQADELITRTQTETSEYVGQGSEIIVDKIDNQVKTVSSLEQMPANIVDDFTAYSESVIKQVATQLKTTQEITQIQVNPQLMSKCRDINETCKQFSNGQIQTV